MRLLSLSQVARQLGLSDPTARKIAPQLPGAVRLNKRIRYREDAILEFIQSGGCGGSASREPAARQV